MGEKKSSTSENADRRGRSRSGRAPLLERRTPSRGRPRFSSRHAARAWRALDRVRAFEDEYSMSAHALRARVVMKPRMSWSSVGVSL